MGFYSKAVGYNVFWVDECVSIYIGMWCTDFYNGRTSSVEILIFCTLLPPRFHKHEQKVLLNWTTLT
jgi:hypothetical protein